METLGEKKKSTKKKKAKDDFYIVGIGTSAGGLKALQSFFQSCPDSSKMGFVVVQHLSPDYKSLMPELLAKHTKMPVAEAEDGVLVEPNKVYLIPGRKNITIQAGRLVLQNRPPIKQLNFSIDIFLESLALEKAHMAIGVVLSGTGSDGTKGAKAIKEVGGTVFVQTPKSSGFDGMPRSVISHNLADYILHPKDMAVEIIQYVKNPQFNYLISCNDLSHQMESINRILKVVKDNSDIDFTGYKMPTILRRTAKRLNITKCKSIEEYIDLLYRNKAEAIALSKEYLIGVTNFFRDDEVFKYMKNTVIPEVINKALKSNRDIKMWVIACSTGEEVYSLAMLLEEHMASIDKKIGYKIYATDIDETALYKASKGTYSETDVKIINPELRKKYFELTEGGHKIILGIRQNVIFSKHNIVVNPPFSKMDLVSCRNMLIYLDTEFKTQAMNAMKYALNPDGFLLLGNSETPGIFDKSFKQVNIKCRVYQNTGSIIYPAADLRNWTLDPQIKTKVRGRRQIHTVEEIIGKAFNNKVVEQYQSASVCVDENLTIIHAVGKLKRYINIPDNGFSSSLSKILPDNVLIPIQSAIRKLNREKIEMVTKSVRFDAGDSNITLKVDVEKISITNYNSNSFLITFMEIGQQPLPKDVVTSQSKLSNDEVRMLKDSLKETKENLQLTIEELETSNEEMQATNEELLAANEELQSTNEELQSVNEELHTVNAELQSKNTMLIELNSDVENLFRNVQIGTIFLDNNNCIRRYTPNVEMHFGFREEDIGRSITLYSGSVIGSKLADIAEEVKTQGEMQQIEIQHSNGSWYWVEVFPYKNISKNTIGVTINFININKLKNQSVEIKTLYSSLNELTDSTPSLIAIYDLDAHKTEFLLGNPDSLCGLNKEQILSGFDLLQLMDLEGKTVMLKHLNRLLESKTENTISKVKIKNVSTNEYSWVLINSKIHERDSNGKPTKTINVIQDITTIIDTENELKSSEERYRLALTSHRVGLWECEDIRRGKTWWSSEYKNLLGYTDEEYEEGYEHFVSLIHKDNYDDFMTEIDNALSKSSAFSCLIKLKIKSEGYKWFEVNGFAEKNITTRANRVICSIVLAHDKIVDRLVIESKEKLLANIFENAPIGFIISNAEGIIKESSTGFNKMIGVDGEQLIGTKFIDVEKETEKNTAAAEFGRLVKFEFPFISFDKNFECNDKSEKRCRVHVSPIVTPNDDGGAETMYCAIISDITQNWKFENELNQINTELYDMNTNSTKLILKKLHTIQKSIKEANKGEGDLMLKTNKDLEDIYTHLDSLSRHYKLINTRKQFINLNLNKLVKEISKEILTERKLKIKSDILPGINAIESQLKILIKELIITLDELLEIENNQLDFTTNSEGQYWQIGISAHAKSISKTQVKSINDFLKDSKEIKNHHQMQVRLISCRKIVSNHQGTLRLVTHKNSSLTFRFTLSKTLS